MAGETVLLSDPLLLAVIAVLAVLLIIMFILWSRDRKTIKDINKRLDRLLRGKTASSLESEIIHLFEANDILTEDAHDIHERLDKQQALLETSFRKLGLIKYDAFNQMGGKLSFALALLNDDDNGIVLNSVHSQEGNYTYVKEIKDGRSDLELGTEEKQALDRALAQE